MQRETEEEKSARTWPWVIVGALLATWIAGLGSGEPGRGRTSARAPLCVSTGLESSGERVPSARELRSIDGVGPVRALRLARAWWENGPPPSQRALEDLEDIGPATAAKVWEALAESTMSPSLTPSDRPP